MPKTFTDDIAPALPSAINGPFQVVDPADGSNWVKIDPGGAQIAAAGAARPTQSISLPLIATYLTSTNQFIGVIMAKRINYGANGGFYTAAMRIPLDMDVGEPAHVWTLVATGQTGPSSSQIIRILLADTYVRGNGAAITTTLALDWSAPASWQIDDQRFVLIDNGLGRTFEAGRFAAGDLVGFRLSRNGNHPNDTYTQSVAFAQFIVFEYTAKRF